MLIVLLAFRNALRNVTRTMLTAGTVVFGTALFVLSMAWMEGVFGDMLEASTGLVGHVRLVDPEFAAREALLPLYENVADAEAAVAAAKAHPEVVAAYPRIQTGVTITVGEEIGDVFGMVVGAPDAYFRERLDAHSKIADGVWLSGAPGELVMGRVLAGKAGARVGDEVVLLGVTQDGSMSPIRGTLVGITAAGNALMDQQIFLPLEQAQYLTDIEGGATEVLVYGAHRDDAAELAAVLRADPALSGLLVEPWLEREPWAGALAMTGVVSGILTGIIVFITALGVWNTMMMSVLERTGEIGVMRALGLGRFGAVGLFVVEAVAIATIGGVLGVMLGGAAGYWLELNGVAIGESVTQKVSAQMVMSTTFYADMSPRVAVNGFLLGLVMAIVGSAPPALRAASIQPVTAMRSRR